MRRGISILKSTAARGLVALAMLTSAAAAPQPPQVPGPPPVSPEIRARYSVVVTAEQTVTARVYEYLELLSKRNTRITRFGGRATAAELELVLLFERYPRMPWNRRDIGTVNLKLDAAANAAAVEYCLRRCTEHNADLVLYTQPLSDFLTKLDEASASLARRYR